MLAREEERRAKLAQAGYEPDLRRAVHIVGTYGPSMLANSDVTRTLVCLHHSSLYYSAPVAQRDRVRSKEIAQSWLCDSV